MRKDTLVSVKNKLGDLPVWADLLKVKVLYLKSTVVQIRNGAVAMLWTDPIGGLLCVVNTPFFFSSTKKKV
jgi:hypothetical protein